jgi:hypothetical protein
LSEQVKQLWYSFAMDNADHPANPESDQEAPSAPMDWLMLGFIAMVMSLALLVALMILIAHQNGTGA